jgi:hypothetical protein
MKSPVKVTRDNISQLNFCIVVIIWSYQILRSLVLTALNSMIDSELKVLFIKQMITKEVIRHKETGFPHWDENVLFKVARIND